MSRKQNKLPTFIRAGFWLFAVFFTEVVCGAVPAIDPPGPSYSGAWVAFVVLLGGALRLATSFKRPSSAFVYGAWGSLCFVLRGHEVLVHAARYGQGPNEAALVAGWIGFVLFSGAMCWLAANMRIESAGDDSGSPDP